MDINAENIELTKEIFKIQDVKIISELKNSLKRLLSKEEIQPMTLERFYIEIEESLNAIEESEILQQDEVENRFKN